MSECRNDSLGSEYDWLRDYLEEVDIDFWAMDTFDMGNMHGVAYGIIKEGKEYASATKWYVRDADKTETKDWVRGNISNWLNKWGDV